MPSSRGRNLIIFLSILLVAGALLIAFTMMRMNDPAVLSAQETAAQSGIETLRAPIVASAQVKQTAGAYANATNTAMVATLDAMQ